ncbi:MAG: extracellular solute-binding protein [Ruminiclostridium sp.]|nr:extracellular solute-binding protein [Ruminiclostridium sp.]
MKKAIKVMSLLLALCFIVTLAACGGNNASQTTNTTQSSSEASSTAPATNEPVKITFLMQDWGNIKGSEDEKRVLDIVKEKTGVELVPILIPLDTYDDKVNLKFAAGEEFDLYTELKDAPKRYAEGQIISLSPYIDEYGPLFKDENMMPKDFLAYATVDGNLIGQASGQASTTRYTISVRKDWVDKLGMALPTTIEEFQAYLEKVKVTDLNGNGQSDEIPLYTGGWAMGPVWQEVFLVHGGNDWIDENGGYNIPILDPNYKLMLQTMQDWYKKGLIWKEAYTANPTQLREIEATNIFGAMGFWYTEPETTISNFRASVPEAVNVVILPKGPGLNKKLEGKRPYSMVSVTSKCKNPEKAVALLNYALSVEGDLLLTYGVEGINWQYADTEKKSINFMGVVNNDYTQCKYYTQFARFGGLTYTFLPYVNNMNSVVGAARDLELSKLPKEPILGKDFLYDNTKWESTKKLADRDTFISEMQTKILMGQASVDEWDNVIKKWREMDGDLFLKEKGQAYKEISEKTGMK